MKNTTNRMIRAAAVGILALAGTTAHAAWPEKPLRLIWPFSGGGIGATMTRVIAEGLGERLGQTVVVEERGGAGGIVGFQSVKNSPPDGYTLLLGTNSTTTLLPSMHKNMPLDILGDFEFIGMVAVGSNVVVVRSDSDIHTFEDLRQEAKASPGKINYGSAGIGTTFHVTPALFDRLNGSTMVHIPYKGSDPAFLGLLGGETQVVFGSTGSLQHIKSGKLRALAVMGPERFRELPDVPTTAELGMPDLVMESFFGILAPAGTPKPIVDRLSKELQATMADDKVRERIRSLLLDPARDSTPDYFREQVRSTTLKWKPVIEDAKIVIE